jgi:hypothetical protein
MPLIAAPKQAAYPAVHLETVESGFGNPNVHPARSFHACSLPTHWSRFRNRIQRWCRNLHFRPNPSKHHGPAAKSQPGNAAR